MRLYLAEKPSVRDDLAAVLGNPKKGGGYVETDAGVVTNAIGHLLENMPPEAYGEQFAGRWNFAALPVVPDTWKMEPVKDTAAQLKLIGSLLAKAGEVVIATDSGREGELIAREILAHFNYRGPLKRLWTSATDKKSLAKALGSLKSGAETAGNYHAALARQRADWLIGMNMTRAVTVKNTGGVFSIGRVQTPTTALVVRRDREIEHFTPRDYFEIAATVTTDDQKTVTLIHAPKDEDRIFDRAAAEGIANAVSGQTTALSRITEDKAERPPKLLDLPRLQRAANERWGWPAKKTLDIAQSLYETHKCTTYPRVDCEFLPEEMLPDVPALAADLVKLPELAHLAGQTFTPRNTVFNNRKLAEHEHHAIVPNINGLPAPLDKMSEDERRAFALICAHYAASLLPDYQYKSTKISAGLADREFAVTGTTPVFQGWKIAFKKEEDEDMAKQDKGVVLPDIEDGAKGAVTKSEVLGKKTKPPSRYTEASLLGDMENVAKYVENPEHKARLKEKSGLGTPATRADIIEKIKAVGYVETKGTQLISTPKARDLITALESDLPVLADPAATAIWEDALEDIASGNGTTDAFVAGIAQEIRANLAILAKKPDPASPGPEGKPTGVETKGVPILDHGDFFTARGAFTGRIYKDLWGHILTADELVRLLAGETLDLADCKKKDGSPAGPQKAKYNAGKKPFPGVEILGTSAPAVATSAESPRKGGGAIQDHGDYFTAPGFESAGRPVRFYKNVAERPITADELAAILAAKKEGVKFTGFTSKKTGKKFDAILAYNARKQPYAGLDFKFD
jgi:DNA topoisomerase-3